MPLDKPSYISVAQPRMRRRTLVADKLVDTDDDIPLTNELRPRLTTVRMPLEDMVCEAIRLALTD